MSVLPAEGLGEKKSYGWFGSQFNSFIFICWCIYFLRGSCCIIPNKKNNIKIKILILLNVEIFGPGCEACFLKHINTQYRTHIFKRGADFLYYLYSLVNEKMVHCFLTSEFKAILYWLSDQLWISTKSAEQHTKCVVFFLPSIFPGFNSGGLDLLLSTAENYELLFLHF